MEARYAIRKRQLLDECQVSPEIFEHVIPRLGFDHGAGHPLPLLCNAKASNY